MKVAYAKAEEICEELKVLQSKEKELNATSYKIVDADAVEWSTLNEYSRDAALKREARYVGKSEDDPSITVYATAREADANRRKELEVALGEILSDGSMDGTYIYVVTEGGELRLMPWSPSNTHAWLTDRGEKVRVAGEVVIKNGRVVSIDNHSGHYMLAPAKTAENLQGQKKAALEAFEAGGARVSAVAWKYFLPEPAPPT